MTKQEIKKSIEILVTENPNRGGAPLGNKNATKPQTKTQYATRLPVSVIALIRSRSAELGISQAVYIEMLVKRDGK